MYKVIEPLIENTIFEARIEEDKIISYIIRPKEGYKLHEKTLDEPVFDEYGNETNKIKKGYTTAYTTAGINYDFKENPREIYAAEDVDDEL